VLTIGLDIGGANTKLAVTSAPDSSSYLHLQEVLSRYFPFWLQHRRLSQLLEELLEEFEEQRPTVAATLTAELSDCFRTKRDGVLFILRSLEKVAPLALVLTSTGKLIPLKQAQSEPLMCAAANWIAPPLVLWSVFPEFLFIDSGSTTTDIIPVRDGTPLVTDPTDTGRLAHHELLYTGALRTNVATIVDHVEIRGTRISVASENFATTADVNLVLGLISENEYTIPSSDNGPNNLTGAFVRLARVVCSDIESMSRQDIESMAKFIHRRQVERISTEITNCISSHGLPGDVPCVVAGVGSRFLAREAAKRAGLRKIVTFDRLLRDHIQIDLGRRSRDALHHAPATALSILPHLRPELCG